MLGWLSTRIGIGPGPARSLLDLVPAVHLAVDEPQRPHHRVDARRAAARRAAEEDLELVRRTVVGADQHGAHEAVELGSRRGRCRQRAERLDRDRELQRRGGREARASVPGCARDPWRDPGRRPRPYRGKPSRAPSPDARAARPRSIRCRVGPRAAAGRRPALRAARSHACPRRPRPPAAVSCRGAEA